MSEVRKAAELIAAAVAADRPIVAFTGAGVSQESGIPTFRGSEGIWRKYDPEQVATFEGFLDDPELCWRFHEELRSMCVRSRPNAAHLALAWIERTVVGRASVPVVTQNIDGLHQSAGSTQVLELHGSCHRMRCIECTFVCDEMPERFEALPPTCDVCGSLLRPDVVWFGEQLPAGAMKEAQRLSETAGVMLVIGTSATVQPAASLPILALRAGAALIEVNSQPTPLTPMVDVSLQGAAGTTLPELADAVGALHNGAAGG
ncbi:MAG: SIR2 family NAD-dependent protein deacylase [Armatimonadota bacterium]